MNAEEVKHKLNDKLDQIERNCRYYLIKCGDTADECQLLLLVNRINDLRKAINGIVDEDLK